MLIAKYNSPLGEMLLASDSLGLNGVWFKGQKYYGSCLDKECEIGENATLEKAREWLDIYFSGEIPDFMPKLHLIGTDFQKLVWRELLNIQYGEVTTYKAIAERIKNRLNKTSMSAQAIGGAVGRNNISIIVPCHRVLSVNGSLTGYASGVDKKLWLLKLENNALIN